MSTDQLTNDEVIPAAIVSTDQLTNDEVIQAAVSMQSPCFKPFYTFMYFFVYMAFIYTDIKSICRPIAAALAAPKDSKYYNPRILSLVLQK